MRQITQILPFLKLGWDSIFQPRILPSAFDKYDARS